MMFKTAFPLCFALLLLGKVDSFSTAVQRHLAARARSVVPVKLNPKLLLQLPSTVTVESKLDVVDTTVVSRVVRVANHAPALASLSYFGLISMASMMQEMNMSLKPTLASVLTKYVGSTTNSQFAAFFPTLVTPPSFVFLVWPLISVVQLATISYSALRPSKPLLSQDKLTALSLANLASSAWLLVSSRAAMGALPLAAFLVLPIVPLCAGYPLRKLVSTNDEATKPTIGNVIFQLFSGFTVLASILAFTVELQHGGRVPFFKGRAEICALVFLALYNYGLGFSVSIVRRSVNSVAILGILLKRLGTGWGVATSLSFYATAYVAWNAIKKLLKS